MKFLKLISVSGRGVIYLEVSKIISVGVVDISNALESIVGEVIGSQINHVGGSLGVHNLARDVINGIIQCPEGEVLEIDCPPPPVPSLIVKPS